MPSPNRLMTEVMVGRESKYLQIEDLNSEHIPNKPFASQVSVGAGRDKIKESTQVSKMPQIDEQTGFNETMSKVLSTVQIGGHLAKDNMIYTNGSFLDMQLTDIKAEDKDDKDISERFH